MNNNMSNGYDRKTLVILRAALIVIGGVVGGTAVWQYFVFYPELMSREFQIVIIVVSAAIAAALLGLSAKPFYRLGSSLRDKYQKLFSGVGARGIIAVSLGCIAAIGITLAVNIGLMIIVEILAVRILADILICIALAFLCCIALLRLLAPKTRDEIGRGERGYLIAAACFYDDRVYNAVDFLNGVYVSENAAMALLKIGEASPDAIERYKKITGSGKVKIIKDIAGFETAEDYMRAEESLASERKLKLVSLETELYKKESGYSLAAFAMPSDDIIEKYNVAGDESSAEKRDSSVDDETHGQIIIDK